MTNKILSGRVCLITGSSRGIGLGIARVFADNGAIVILHGRDKATLGQSLAILPESPKHNYIVADLNELEGSKKLTERLIRLHAKLDVLVHSAGILGPKTPLAAYPQKDWDEVIRVNLTVPFLLTQEVLPLLRKGDHPSVIFISSGVGRVGRADWGAYAVSKFGVEGLTQVWADELRGENIRVNAVNPGGTRTQMRAAAYPEEDPMILPTPEDVAPVFVWLARADTNISGQSLEARDWIGRDPAS
ncbi:MAG: SDR family NAD(P)-dependent oxidoreductase [Deltaproteobacteria bacterium]|nr:MAG: SDR family NAD(P)-dependent oxidoreductase [Deltaproteobacteria bacterium]